jgi:hypothetical protein
VVKISKQVCRLAHCLLLKKSFVSTDISNILATEKTNEVEELIALYLKRSNQYFKDGLCSSNFESQLCFVTAANVVSVLLRRVVNLYSWFLKFVTSIASSMVGSYSSIIPNDDCHQ